MGSLAESSITYKSRILNLPHAFVAAIRADVWWEHKLALILGSGYATAFYLRVSLWHLLPTYLLTLLALAIAATYTSLINDLSDLTIDRAVGKRTGLAGRSRGLAVAAVAAACCAGAAVGFVGWRHDGGAAACYAGVWLAFSLYSIPPFRLKLRGFAGVMADAVGAGLFPHLIIAFAVFHAAGKSVQVLWMLLLGAWALAHGVKSAIIHQLDDVEADTKLDLRTFARLHPELSRRLGAFVVFPIEVTAFLAVLLWARNWLALALLPAYALLEFFRADRRRLNIRVISPAPQRVIAMHGYYVVVYPVAFVLAATARHHRDVLVLVVHTVVFPRAIASTVADGCRAVHRLVTAASPGGWRHQAPHGPE